MTVLWRGYMNPLCSRYQRKEAEKEEIIMYRYSTYFILFFTLFVAAIGIIGCATSNSGAAAATAIASIIESGPSPSPSISPTPTSSPGLLHLAFVSQPYDTVVDSRMRPEVRVEVLDASNHRVTGNQSIITMSMTKDPESLGGKLSVQAHRGEARFDELVPEKTGSDFALIASAAGMADVTSPTFQVIEKPSGLVSIQVDPASATVVAGHSQTLTATGVFSKGQYHDITAQVTWTSSSSSVAAVTSTGTVTGKQVGTATITAELDGIAGTAKITITSVSLIAITITPTTASVPLHMHKTFTATGTFSDNSTKDITSEAEWSSSDEKVATALNEGVVIANSVGTASITAADPGGVKGSATLNVTSSGTVGPIFSTYLGGKTAFSSSVAPLTFAQNTTVDESGCTYVTGGTTVSDLPVVNAYQSRPAEGSIWTGFVAKYSAEGQVIWCTYLGGNGQTMGVGIGVLPNGCVAVNGWTSSNNFPVMNGYQEKYGNHDDAFLTVYDANGIMQYSTYLGGKDVEGPSEQFTDNNSIGNCMAVDAQGLVYITGETNSTNFALTSNAIQTKLNLTDTQASPPAADAYLSIFDVTKKGAASLIYSSLLGGDNDEKGHAVTVSTAGDLITVVGYTPSKDFPTTPNALRSKAPTVKFTSNGFVSQFTSSTPGSASSKYTARYSTYLGADTGGIRDDTYAVTLAPGGIITVTGRTQSANFPVTKDQAIYNSSPYLVPGDADEAYIVKLDPSLSGTASLLYGTFLGGGGATQGGVFGTGIAIDSSGATLVGGQVMNTGVLYTLTPPPQEAPKLFPYTSDAFMTSLEGSTNCMLMQATPDGRTLAYSTYFGGNTNDRTYGLAIDRFGNIHWTGLTQSNNFPLRNPAQKWPHNGTNQNAFITVFGTF